MTFTSLSKEQNPADLARANERLRMEIEEYKRVEARLSNSRQQLMDIIDFLPDATFVIDKECKVIAWNRAIEEMSGVKKEEIIGQGDYAYSVPFYGIRRPHLLNLLDVSEADLSSKYQHIQRQGGTLCAEVFVPAVYGGQGAYVWVIAAPLFDTEGKRIGAIESIRDISRRKQMEEEKNRLDIQLLHAQKLESLGVLAGGIAHDFNNILMAIIGNADLALMRINRESPAVENLHRIELAAARAADLAKQMLAYSGKGKFVVENIDFNLLLEEMLHMLEVSISKKTVLQLDLHRPLPAVEADATQMRQIIMNLVINASEAIGDENGIISITTGCIECDRYYLKDLWLDENLSEGQYVFVEIADTGCGMDRETLTKLFDPFFTTKFAGRGLGMAAVLGIIRGHRGAIKVYSEPDKGTSFKILLPLSNNRTETFSHRVFQDEWHGSGTVLLVDDEETVRSIGGEMLQTLGFQVITAEDGIHALEKFKNTPAISFVILDLTMPRMDGEQCFRELRQARPDLKIIISSGYNEQEVTMKFAGKGLAGFIQKPYSLTVLKEVIRGI